VRGGLAIPPGAFGFAPTAGIEFGVMAAQGMGYGITLLGAFATPSFSAFPSQPFAFGLTGNLRYDLQVVPALSFAPMLSLGFLSGRGASGTNASIPLITPALGVRWKPADMYVAFDFGLADFFIPYMNITLGFHGNPSRDPEASR